MTAPKTRIEAREASVKKWVDILDRLEKIANDIDTMCGFCDLAQLRSEGLERKVFRCKVCEPDAKKLCEDYITDDRLTTNSIDETIEKTNTLLTNLKNLPDVLKEE